MHRGTRKVLSVVATDAAHKAIRRVSLTGGGVDDLCLQQTKVEAWTRRDICAFTRGMLVLANQNKVMKTHVTLRFFFTWRMKMRRRSPELDQSSIVLLENTPEQSRTVLHRLISLSLLQVAEIESLRKDLMEQRGVAESNASFSDRLPPAYAKRFIVMQMGARVKRCMRLSFDKWKRFLRGTLEQMRINSLEQDLLLGQQSVRSRRGQVEELRDMNKTLSQFMGRAKSFYLWKARTVGAILEEKRAYATAKQGELLRELRVIKNALLSASRIEKVYVEEAVSCGEHILTSLEGLRDGVTKIAALHVC